MFRRGQRLYLGLLRGVYNVIIKNRTPLMERVQTYLRWKHSDKRYVACASALCNGMIKVLSVSNSDSKDYYHEWISPRTMNLEIKQNNLLTEVI